MQLPAGTVTFLFTDIEGSTILWEQFPEAMRVALGQHDTLLREVIERNNGILFKAMGDSICSAFALASDALAAALEAQRALQNARWPDPITLRVRMALHTGSAEERNGDYFGPVLNRVARLLAIAHGEQTLLSSTTQELARDHLPPDVTLLDCGLHGLRDLARPEQVFQLQHPALPRDFPPLRSRSAIPNNLPQPTTSFIGREKEMAEIEALLETTRLLTLVGAGGCGKTRLLLQIAVKWLERESEGIWFVEFAPLTDPKLVPQTLAALMGIREEAGNPLLQTLAAALKTKRLLLILDNCEHLITACARLADTLLRSCPNVQMLASSREALGIAGERTYRVPSLSVPPSPPFLSSSQGATQGGASPTQKKKQAQLTAETVLQYESTCLFIERARLHEPDFAVTDQNAPALASICYHLDGIPLAIELAAARVRALPIEEINSRLDNRFRLLTGGSRAALPRQQTLRALIDWSYNLLADPEKTLLHRLSVFAGGWTLEAAESVCCGEQQGDSEALKSWEVLDLLTALVDKSLVMVELQEREARYRLTETIQRYVREKLQESGESEQVLRRHRNYFLRLAQEAAPQIGGTAAKRWLERIESEHDNMRVALAWCRGETGEGEAGLHLAAALSGVWVSSGYLNEGRAHLETALAHPDAQGRTAARSTALYAAANLARVQTDYAAADALIVEDLTIARERSDTPHEASCLLLQATTAVDAGEPARALPLAEQALALYQLLRDDNMEIFCLNTMAEAARGQGDFAAARPLYERVLAMCHATGNRFFEGIVAWNLGQVALGQGRVEEAQAFSRDALLINQDLDNRWGMAHDFELCAAVALAQNDFRRAARLFGAADALREQLNAPLERIEHALHQRRLAALQEALGAELFGSAWEEGGKMPPGQAAHYALQSPDFGPSRA